MTEKLQVYKCDCCGNIVYVLHSGKGELVCCEKPMELLEEKTADASTEKHVPVIEKSDGAVVIKVGSVPHPMVEDHYIEWIEAQEGNKISIQFLKAGSAAEAAFAGGADSAREYCNKHGLWKA